MSLEEAKTDCPTSVYSKAVKNCTQGLIEKVKTPAADARTGKATIRSFYRKRSAQSLDILFIALLIPNVKVYRTFILNFMSRLEYIELITYICWIVVVHIDGQIWKSRGNVLCHKLIKVWLSYKDIALGLDVVNSRQEHLAKRVSLQNEKFYESEETFNVGEAVQKTRQVIWRKN